MLQLNSLTNETAVANQSEAMDADTISKNGVKLLCFLMITFLFFGTDSMKGQSSNSNILKELSRKNNKVYVMVENIDSVPNFYQTVVKHMANLGYWKQTNNISDADAVFVFTGFRIGINGYPHFECCVKVFDNKMNFISRGEYLFKTGTIWDPFEFFFDKTIRHLVKDLPRTLRSAKISKTSPYYASSTTARKYDEIKFAQYYSQLLESLENKQNKQILENVNRCISINPESAELYEIKSAILLEQKAKMHVIVKKAKNTQGKEPFKTIGKLKELEPLNPNVDYYWQYARDQVSNRGVRFIQSTAAINAIGSALNQSIVAYGAIKSASTVTSSSATISNSSQNSGQKDGMKQVTCTFCNGTGVSPTAMSVSSFGNTSQHWCDVCKSNVSSSHGYHGSCPSCNGKGYRLVAGN